MTAVKRWWKWLAFCSVAVAMAAVVLDSFEFARVEGNSMAPTLLPGDRIVIDKLTYLVTKPARGDVILLRSPEPCCVYVKRIIALPKDKVEIRRGQVFINGNLLAEPAIPPGFRGDGNWGPHMVPKGSYVVLGDHRNRSSDSRIWGPIPSEAIVGKARFMPNRNALAAQ